MKRKIAIVSVVALLGAVMVGAGAAVAQDAQRWVYQGTVQQSGESRTQSVAVEGAIAAVGGVGDTYVYTDQNGPWVPAATLGPPGSSVDIDDGRIAVGNEDADPDGDGDSSGGVIIFEKNASGAWTQTAQVGPPDSIANKAGESVDLEGDTLLVGDPWGNGFGDGRAYVFTKDGSGTWTHQATLEANEPTGDDFGFFGDAVSLDGDTAIVGDWGRNKAFVFTRNAGSWSLDSKLTADGTSQMGYDVALESGTALVSDPDVSKVFVFNQDDSGSWSQDATLEPTCGPYFADSGEFGHSIALEGDTALVGDPKEETVPRAFEAGGAFTFTRSDEGSWGGCERIVPPDKADRFGHQVDLGGDHAWITDAGPSFNRDPVAHAYLRIGGGI